LYVSPVKLNEVPCSGNNFCIRLSGRRAGIKEDHGLDINRASSQEGALIIYRIRRYPDAVLQVPETATMEVAPQVVSPGAVDFRYVEEHQPPSPIPWAIPKSFRIATAQSACPACFGQPMETIPVIAGLSFDQILFLKALQLAEETVTVSPALERICQVPKGRTCERFASPEQHAQKFLGFGFHQWNPAIFRFVMRQ
jgi:hypothetical protein